MQRPIRMLLVEDSPGDAFLLHEELAHAAPDHFEIEEAATLARALEIIGSSAFDIVLLDLTLPDSQGVETFHVLHAAAPAVPVVVLTGHTDEALGVTIVRDGAQDYLIKGETDGRLLLRSIRYAIERSSAEKALRESEERVIQAALHDPVTGLPNAALFMDRLEHSFQVSRRHDDLCIAVLALDLDRFKVIVDSMGHQVGNQTLVTMGERLRACVRPGDTVARLGGDEFAILVEDARDVLAVSRMAERILSEVRVPLRAGGREVYTTASVGVALSSNAYERGEDILRDADTAMFRAKTLGRNRHEVFDATMHTRAMDLMQLEMDLRRAVDRGELHLHYQPIVMTATGRIAGFEALMRWHHPTRGLVTPCDFMHLAEETGLIVEAEGRTLDEACHSAVAFRSVGSGRTDLLMSVNVSARQFAGPGLTDLVAGALERTRLPPECLEVEITESALVEHGDTSVGILEGLKNLGVRIQIDDFGTGYSSLSYLTRFPADILKIDRSFIRGVLDGSHNYKVVRSIVKLAHALGMEVTAEGVETANQLFILRELGCERVQGTYLGDAMDRSAASDLLAKDPRW